MIKLEEFKVIIPLRGGSKGIPRKNIKLFLGRPLFTWTVNAALGNNLHVIVSSEDDEICDSVKKFSKKVDILKRPNHLARDESSTEDVINHFVENFKSKYIILLQATSPFTTSELLLSAINLFIEKNKKPLVSGTKSFDFYWSRMGYPINYDSLKRPRRQDWDGNFVENGAIYIFKSSDFLNKFSRCPPPCTLFEMPRIHSIELDNLDDWIMAEEIAKKNLL